MSGVQGESFGINSDAYHVPKGVILDWMNQTFDVSTLKNISRLQIKKPI